MATAPTSYINKRPRYFRRTLMLAQIENTYNESVLTQTPLTWSVDSHALLVESVSFEYSSNNKDFNALLPYLGAREQVVGDDYVTIKFTVPFTKSPYPTRDRHYGFLFQACGMTRNVVAAAANQIACTWYGPNSALHNGINSKNSAAFAYVIDGVKYQATGGRGNWEANFKQGEIVSFTFTFTCMFDGELNEETFVAPEFGQYGVPTIVQTRSSGTIVLGCEYLKEEVALSGGGEYGSTGLTLNYGNTVVYDPELGNDVVSITDRDVTGSISLNLSANREFTLRNQVRANAVMGLGFAHGFKDKLMVAGHHVLVYGPAVQLINPAVEEKNGVAMTKFDLRFRTLDKQNDNTDNFGDNEIRLVFA